MEYRINDGMRTRNRTSAEVRIKRQADAELRKFDREQRSDLDQLSKLETEGHTAGRERRRLSGLTP